MKKTSAQWSMQLDVECPHCDHCFDLDDPTDKYTIENFGQIGENPSDLREEISCPECEKTFMVTSAIY